jgi:hypothetical protein
MDVVLYCEWESVVDNGIHIGNIQSTSSHVGSDQKVRGTSLELVQRFHASALRHVSVECTHSVPVPLKELLHTGSLFLIQGEDKNSVLFVPLARFLVRKNSFKMSE